MNQAGHLRTLADRLNDEWKDLTPSERVDEVWRLFAETYSEIAHSAFEIEAIRGNLNEEATHPSPRDLSPIMAAIKDSYATQALNRGTIISEMMDTLEAAQGVIAIEFFGDESQLGERAGELVVMINQIKWIAGVIQDTSAEVKSRTMDDLRIERPRLSAAMKASESQPDKW